MTGPDARGCTAAPRPRSAPAYAELHAHSSYSFLDGASSPTELAEQAARLGLTALAVTDHDGLYGVVRAAEAADELGLGTIFGAELSVDGAAPRTAAGRARSARSGVPDPGGRHLLVLARDPDGYANLARTISLAQLRGGTKGHPVYDWDELAGAAGGGWLVLTGCRKGPVRAALEAGGYGTFALDPARAALAGLVERFGRDNVAVELTYALEPAADERYAALAELAAEARLPVVATTGAHYHEPSRHRLAHTVAAVRAGTGLDELDGWLPGWGGSCLRDGAELAARFAAHPSAVPNAARLGAELAFPLAVIAPDLPPFDVPVGHRDEMDYLRHLTYRGAAERYGPRGPDTERAYARVEHELRIIAELNYPGYFLIVWDIARFCRENGILAQGRGSAANSAVCYCLGVTAADPIRYQLLFERFLAAERHEPPDIDIDIESGRREEVIQYVYQLHGRHRAAQVANVITYRPRSAVRDVAKALGYSAGQQDAWAKQVDHRYWVTAPGDAGSDPGDGAGGAAGAVAGDELIPPLVRELAGQLADAPRHLGIHSGGMVLCDRPVIEVCPVEWARMPGRSVLQWDKDDCAYAGLVKFDLLGLGMLSALRYTFEFVRSWHGERLELYRIPADDPLVFDMLARADTVGVFQIESRAQMSTLPHLKPRSFYELAIEIALIRPGPIQGGSVHPYLRRRDRVDPVTYPHPSLEPVLRRTLGVPLFQEQLMQIAVTVAGFTPGQADELRRAMGSKRSRAKMAALRQRLYDGMAANGITGAVADDIYTKIESFAAFGFPESHAISFAFLANASSWLKLYYPAAFLAGLLDAQPMGFYSPQSLVHDARRHGIVVRAADVNASAAGASLEAPGEAPGDGAPGGGTSGGGRYRGPGPAQPAVRLGLSGVRTIGDELAGRIRADREARGPYRSMTDLAHRVGLTGEHLEALATAGALASLGIGRREALWHAGAAAAHRPGQLDYHSGAIGAASSVPPLPVMDAPEQLIADLWATGVSGTYPTALIRARLDALGVTPAAGLAAASDRTRVTVAGIVTHRQRPPSAGGVSFLSLEDETGVVNVIVPAVVWTRHRQAARYAGGLVIRGMLEVAHDVHNVMAERIERLHLGVLRRVPVSSRDFR